MAEPIQYGGGIYRRKIRLIDRDGVSLAELEDDFHHFRVSLQHDGTKVTEVRAEAVRYPWTSCPGATEPLHALEGMTLSTNSVAHARELNAREHCTHMFDIAGLALAHAAADRTERVYEIDIPDRIEERTQARLLRDGQEILLWAIDGMQIVGPDPFSGRSVGKGFVDWACATFDDDMAEAVIVLRRSILISLGRLFPLDRIKHARQLAKRTLGACYTFTPGVMEDSERVMGTTHDFTDAPELLLNAKRD